MIITYLKWLKKIVDFACRSIYLIAELQTSPRADGDVEYDL